MTCAEGIPIGIQETHRALNGRSPGGTGTAGRLATVGYEVYATGRRGAHKGQLAFAMLPLDMIRDQSGEAAVDK